MINVLWRIFFLSVVLSSNFTFSGLSHFTWHSQHSFSCWYKLLSQSAPDFSFLSIAVYSKSSVIILWVAVIVIVFSALCIFHFFFLLFPFAPSFCCKVDCIPDVTNSCEGFYAVHFLTKSQLGCTFLVGCLCWRITQQQFLFLLPALLFLSPAILIMTVIWKHLAAHSCNFLHFIPVLHTCHIWFTLLYFWLLTWKQDFTYFM